MQIKSHTLNTCRMSAYLGELEATFSTSQKYPPKLQAESKAIKVRVAVQRRNKLWEECEVMTQRLAGHHDSSLCSVSQDTQLIKQRAA